MTAEAGHDPSRVYRSQDGAFHVNSAPFYNDSEEDISAQLEALNDLSAAKITSIGGQGAGVLAAIVGGVAAGYKVARGVEAVTGSGTVVTGLATVVAVIATPQDDLDGDALMGVSATIGDQAGTPAAGSVILKAWKSNGDGDATMVAATAEKDINWVAIGT